MNIKTMTTEQLVEAMEFMINVPFRDSCFSGWNFDPEAYKNKFNELIDEAIARTEPND